MKSSTYLAMTKKIIHSMVDSLKITGTYLLGLTPTHKEITEEYPDRLSARMPEDLPIRFRGLLANDINRCSGCRFCSDACPIDCIHIETEPGPERNASWVAIFDIDHARCMFCGLCVEVCPTRSLKHTRSYEGSVTEIGQLVHSFGKGYATREMKQRWQTDQLSKEAMAEELAQLEKSPVSAELRRRLRNEGSAK